MLFPYMLDNYHNLVAAALEMVACLHGHDCLLSRTKRVMQKIGMLHNKVDGFRHPNSPEYRLLKHEELF